MTFDQHEIGELLAAYAIDALDDDTSEALRAALDDNTDLRRRLDELRAALDPLAALVTEQTSESLERQVLSRALERRGAGRDLAVATLIDAAGTYVSVGNELASLLDDLTEDEWAAISVYGTTVADLVAHLAAVEHHVGDRLGLWPMSVDSTAGHLAMGGRDHGASFPVAASLWRRRSLAVAAHARRMDERDLDQHVTLHGIEFSVATMLVVRAFEVWSHTEDICRATLRPLRPLRPSVVHTMAGQAIELLERAMANSVAHAGKSFRLTLTGQGGGSWLRCIGGEPPDAADDGDATLVLDVMRFCRLFADRIEPIDLAADRIGDDGLMDDLLSTASTFAEYGEAST